MFGFKRKYREDRGDYLKNFIHGLADMCDKINYIEEFKRKHPVSFSSKGMTKEELERLQYEIRETGKRLRSKYPELFQPVFKCI